MLRQQGILLAEVDFTNHSQLVEACTGGTCLVSALNGLEAVIVGVQTNLLQAAISAGVTRFFPSDYSIDYTKLSPGSNRNLDLRRTFSERLNNAPIAATLFSMACLRTCLRARRRTRLPQKNEVFPPWQGMQYLHNMFTGLPKLNPLDNERYAGIEWTTVAKVLARRKT